MAVRGWCPNSNVRNWVITNSFIHLAVRQCERLLSELSTHPAYEDFRKLRAGLRKDGKPLNSLTLADGLTHYSERGQEYVDSLKSLIRSNGFDLADSALPRDEPLAFAMGAASEEAARSMTDRYEAMKKKGEFDRIVAEMRLE